ncbi:MAG: proprotein convertase P-domain-containing protein, partial [Rubripirellula sp.]
MSRFLLVLTLGCLSACLFAQRSYAQSGLRESLERLDRNENGELDPDEITPLSRPYLERVAEARRMSLDRAYDIERWQEAARVYYALSNGVSDDRVRPPYASPATVQPFGTLPGEPLVPDFGLPEIKYPYTQEDLDEADRTLRRSDRNRDGYIDREESTRAVWTHRDPFDMDMNQDQRLSRMELAQRYARRRLLSGSSDELVKKARRTGNGIEPTSRGSSDRREDSSWWRRGSRYYLTATIMGRFDRNKNGRLEPEEAASIGFQTGAIDVDRDGELSREELHEYLTKLQDEVGDLADGLPGWFFELDVDRDEQVAMSEFTTEWSQDKIDEFTAIDANGDGLLTAGEVLKAKSMVGGSYVNDEAQVLPPRKTVISEIDVTDDYVIGDLNVRISISHTHTSYLDAYLTGPDGQRIELFTEVGGSDDHFEDTVFDDQSRYPITKARPPFKGTFLPEAVVKRQPGLGHFNGKSIKGVWQLVVRCSRSERFGMLHNWSLIVTPIDDMLDSPAAEPDPENDGPQESLTSTSGGYRPPSNPPSAQGNSSSTSSSTRGKSDYTSSRTFSQEAIDKMEARKKAYENYQAILKSREGMTQDEAKKIYVEKFG